MIDDNFGYFGGEAFAATGWRNFTSFFGSEQVHAGGWFGNLQYDAYLWAFGCGGGNYRGAAGVGNATDFAAMRSLAVFNILFGSYFGDWDISENFLRAPLAGRSNSLGLTSIWGGRPHWHFYAMGLGETIGYATRVSQENAGFTDGGYVVNNSGRGVHIALMGDPTLRMHPVAAVAGLNAENSSGTPGLGWVASSESALEGYAISRADSLAGPFYRLGSTLTVGTSYSDRTGIPGRTYTYMVRAVKLETSPSGSYLNASQGVFTTTSFAASVAREINLTGAGQVIVNGELHPDPRNHTDFGAHIVGSGTHANTFLIHNDGESALHLLAPTEINGDASSDFAIANPLPDEIAPGTSASLTLTFSPSALGIRRVIITVHSDDPDEGTFDFAVQGEGIIPPPQVSLSPPMIVRELTPDTVSEEQLTLVNTGGRTLQYTITTAPGVPRAEVSTEPGGPLYAWVEISETGQLVVFDNPDDSLSPAFELGFTFPFLDQNFTQVRVCTNGFITFSDYTAPFGNTGFPSIEAPANLVAAFWDDLILDEAAHIYTQQIGERYIVQFDNVRLFSSPAQRVTCEIILESSGVILLQYREVTETDHCTRSGCKMRCGRKDCRSPLMSLLQKAN